ncbi:MAG: hypothetical protein M1812_004026 [Candelaria pacifica]|nr:MAG: hypothetical protein M1812_004026 [Candelaria pacifica]
MAGHRQTSSSADDLDRKRDLVGHGSRIKESYIYKNKELMRFLGALDEARDDDRAPRKGLEARTALRCNGWWIPYVLGIGRQQQSLSMALPLQRERAVASENKEDSQPVLRSRYTLRQDSISASPSSSTWVKVIIMPLLSVIGSSSPGAPVEILLHIFAHIDRIYSFLELRLLSKHFRFLIETHETSIAAQIIEEYFALEAKCFPPGNTFRNYEHYNTSNTASYRPTKGRLAYEYACSEKGLCFKPNTYEYVEFLERSSKAVKILEQTVIELGMSRTGAYSNCVVWWGFTEGNSWFASLSAFSALPKHVQRGFDSFLDELADRFTRVPCFYHIPSYWPFECSFLGHIGHLDSHVNYEYQWMTQPAVRLPDDVTCEEIKSFDIPRLYAKWKILSYGSRYIEAFFAMALDYEQEAHSSWANDMTIELANDVSGGHFEALDLVLSLPERTSLPIDWKERVRNDQATATFSRALYWNRKGWFFDAGRQQWWYEKVRFHGEWTEFNFDIPALFEHTND